jgi:aryl-alcohol dehydrogenase-like predicted oxidoreductase
MGNMMTRREATKLMARTAASLLVAPSLPAQSKGSLLQRTIPSSGEMLPVIGLGTSRVFNAVSSAAEREPLEQVVARLAKMGGKIVDTSPVYGRAEAVTGEIAAKLKLHDKLFLATKVWSNGKAEGTQQMGRSLDLLGKSKLDLIQVHNLTDWETQLATLQEWKKQGRIRYTGITHSTTSRQADVARVLERERVDFVQINYSLMEREADERVLPVAKDRGVGGDRESAIRARRSLRARVREVVAGVGGGDRLQELGAIFPQVDRGHPTVTCAIPATSKPHHMEDNMQACFGRLPDEKMRQRMVEAVSAL